MSNESVEIERAPGAPTCELWDGRKARHGVTLVVTAEEAATLRQREPSAWIFKTPASKPDKE